MTVALQKINHWRDNIKGPPNFEGGAVSKFFGHRRNNLANWVMAREKMAPRPHAVTTSERVNIHVVAMKARFVAFCVKNCRILEKSKPRPYDRVFAEEKPLGSP